MGVSLQGDSPLRDAVAIACPKDSASPVGEVSLKGLANASPSVETKDLSACTVALKDDAELVPLGVYARMGASRKHMSPKGIPAHGSAVSQSAGANAPVR